MTGSICLKGVGVSPGAALSEVRLYTRKSITYPREAKNIEYETQLFNESKEEALKAIHRLYENMLKTAGETDAAIFLAHEMILNDATLLDVVYQGINQELSAGFALHKAIAQFVEIFLAIDDEVMRSKAADMMDIENQLLCIMYGNEDNSGIVSDSDYILAADDILPSDVANFDLDKLQGIVLESGGPTSHAAILAKSLGIPLIIKCKELLKSITDGEAIAINGETGEVVVRPDADKINDIQRLMVRNDEETRINASYKNMPSVTKDGKEVRVEANIMNDTEALPAYESGADGVGLFRSEFLFLDTPVLPDEEYQFKAYAKAAHDMNGKEIIIRTLDVGGDKRIATIPQTEEDNPFLGCRAVRFCLKNEGLFLTQLKALLRASKSGNLKIMIPMISSLDELKAVYDLIEKAKKELLSEGKDYNENTPVGIMIEIPSAAIMADIFAKNCDFFSIGTNDLTQYTLSVDRCNDQIADLYDTANPAVIKLVSMSINEAHKNNIPCGMCGEAAADPELIPIWLGLGLDAFSVSVPLVTKTRRIISELNYSECQELARRAVECSTAAEVRNLKK